VTLVRADDDQATVIDEVLSIVTGIGRASTVAVSKTAGTTGDTPVPTET
jgi:hypothetical protein